MYWGKERLKGRGNFPPFKERKRRRRFPPKSTADRSARKHGGQASSAPPTDFSKKY